MLRGQGLFRSLIERRSVVPFTSMSDTTAWNEYCEASLDLSNQDEVGEAGAIAALDKLYANNNEGMKRLADS
jgi:hypothetical protein